jgi:hypothetical protein
MRSITLMAQFLLGRDFDSDRTSRALTQSAVKILFSLPIRPSFQPRLSDVPLLDLGLCDPEPASGTSLTCSRDFMFIGYPNCAIRRVSKAFGERKLFATVGGDLGRYSLVHLQDVLFLISPNMPGHVQICARAASTTRQPRSPLTSPAVTDGCYIYCFEGEGRCLVKVYDFHLSLVRVVKLRRRLQIQKPSDPQIASSGAFLSVVIDSTGYIFSAITGHCVGVATKSRLVAAWCYDSDLYGTWSLCDDGLLLNHVFTSFPYWKLGIPIMEPDRADHQKKFYTDNLLLFAAHFAGAEHALPLSEDDDATPLQVTRTMIDVLTTRRSVPGLHTFLIVFQVKYRSVPGFVDVRPALLSILSDDALSEVRNHVAFVYVSTLFKYKGTWADIDTKLMHLILTKKIASWIIFDILPNQPFQVEQTNCEVVQALVLRVFLADDAQPAQAELLLVKAAVRIAKNCALPGVRKLFDQFLGLTFAKFSEAWIAGTESVAFAVLERLCVVCWRYPRIFDRGLIDIEQFLAIAMLQDMSGRRRNYEALLNRVFHLAVFGTLRRAFAEGFVQFEPFLAYPCPQEASEEHRILAKLLNRTRWASPEAANAFVGSIQGKLEVGELKSRLRKIRGLLPQPLWKVQRFLETDTFEVIPAKVSALGRFIDIIQWIHQSPRPSFRFIFGHICNRTNRIEDALLCMPMPLIVELVKRFPSFANIPPSLLAFSRPEISSEFLLKMDISELQNSYEIILETLPAVDADSMLQQFLACESSRRILLRKMLLLGIIGFSKAKGKFGDEIPPVLKRYFLKVDAMSLPFFSKVVQVVISRELCPLTGIFQSLLQSIGLILLKEHERFQNLDHTSLVFQVAFELVDLCKGLVEKNEQFREFLSDNLAKFDRSQLLAFFAVTNNKITVPRGRTDTDLIHGLRDEGASVHGAQKRTTIHS